MGIMYVVIEEGRDVEFVVVVQQKELCNEVQPRAGVERETSSCLGNLFQNLYIYLLLKYSL